MEYNKDEANRAKEIAERKFAEKDFVGAKKFALKANNLYPGLEGIMNLIAIITIYVSSEKKINGEVDYYEVLGVHPSIDDETMRKQYKKLARVLHPDKNRALGAEGAFKILSEAWSCLSDTTRRKKYDQKRNSCPSTPESFWTLCPHCNLHLKYLRRYLNGFLRCLKCRGAFTAMETLPPFLHGYESYASMQQIFAAKDAGSQEAVFFESDSTGRGSSDAPSTFMFQEVQESPKGGHEETPAAATGVRVCKRKATTSKRKGADVASVSSDNASCSSQSEEQPNKKRCTGEMRSKNKNGEKQVPVGNRGVGAETVHGHWEGGARHRVNVPGSTSSRSMRDISQPKIRSMLVAISKEQIEKKLGVWMLDAASKISSLQKEKGNGNNPVQVVGVENAVNPSSAVTGVESGEEAAAAVSMNVPDSDFHDFDEDRTERQFGKNQVWAVYDDVDGMPRYYAMVHKVISLKPFQMQISWLNSKSNSEFGPQNWIASGFSKTSGIFWVGKRLINKSINSFSHKVHWTRGSRGSIVIYPRKGDIWALYRNWSLDWNELTPDEVIQKYDMVEVLEDYNETQGVTVAPLVKVPGFKSVFHRRLDSGKQMTIPREKIFCFSHQVPSCVLHGKEAQNLPEDCLELDPAALPSELLEVLEEVDDGAKLENTEKTRGVTPWVINGTSEEAPVENARTSELKETKEGKNWFDRTSFASES
ncbi:protein of unknown function DUF3444, partial [Dillenia turbinata]